MNMNTFAAIQNGLVLDVARTLGFTPPDRSGVPYVPVPWYVQTGDTTPDSGVTFFRNGEQLSEPLYEIPVGRIMRELKDQELAQWLTLAFPGCNVPFAIALVRLIAQSELKSGDARLKQLLPGFVNLWGASRVAELLRPNEEVA